DIEKELTANENNDQLGYSEPDTTPVIVFKLMCPRRRRRLVFVEACKTQPPKCWEYIIFSFIANDPMESVTLQQWVTKGAQ
ncbi:11719_t:CDS:2, partial [Gigaspora rosea]